ncbi:RNA-directed DNA polymerase from mobile element jockey-like protein [Willisornis vidua]|uniref:RNA-directed DNA polymerase from mobile element jockey-like protein n=1 Tax=Willisornis vidua TaxID=1566151 RepID=A0ABQ9D3Y6_9PASS|nr:RNA-directed DNA polymerase from mobile element jockey-like protein [Willisornis vidua]
MRKSEILNAFFAPVFKNKTSCSPDTWSPEKEDRDEEQNEAPIVQGEMSWLTGDVPGDWKIVNVTPICKKGEKEDLRNYGSVTLTSVPGKIMGQTTSNATMQHMQDNQRIKLSQHEFIIGRSCLSNLISFYDEVTLSVDEGKSEDVFYLNFIKTNTVSHSILLEKLAAHGLDRCTLPWTKTCLDGQAQRAVVNGIKSS